MRRIVRRPLAGLERPCYTTRLWRWDQRAGGLQRAYRRDVHCRKAGISA